MIGGNEFVDKRVFNVVLTESEEGERDLERWRMAIFLRNKVLNIVCVRFFNYDTTIDIGK